MFKPYEIIETGMLKGHNKLQNYEQCVRSFIKGFDIKYHSFRTNLLSSYLKSVGTCLKYRAKTLHIKDELQIYRTAT